MTSVYPVLITIIGTGIIIFVGWGLVFISTYKDYKSIIKVEHNRIMNDIKKRMGVK